MNISKYENEIQKIYDLHGEVTPTLVLKKAKLKKNPLHDYFEWDDSEAAREYRLIQSRKLIRQVKVIHEDRKEKLIHIPCVENPNKEGSYKPAPVIVHHQGEFERAMNAALAQCRAAERAVNDLRDAINEKDDEKLVVLNVVLEGLSVANNALRKIG